MALRRSGTETFPEEFETQLEIALMDEGFPESVAHAVSDIIDSAE